MENRAGSRGWFVLGLLLSVYVCRGQATQPARTGWYSGRMDYDNYFGFYPTLSAGLPVDSLWDVAGYVTYYTNPDFFGLETGLSLSVSSARRNWTLTPGIGLISGSLFVADRPFVPAEGFVGSFTVQHTGRWGFVQGFGGYYGAWKRLTADTYDFLYYSVQAGRSVSKRWRMAVVYEQLANVRLSRNRLDASEFTVPRVGLAADVYLPHELTLQLIGGWTRNDGQRLFFRAGVSLTFSRGAPKPNPTRRQPAGQ